MPHSLCPLCGSPGCQEEPVRCWPIEVRYQCPQHCGTFRMESVFLEYLWPAVHPDDKQAMAAYMQATKGPRRTAPLIQRDNYQEYVTPGRIVRKRVTARPESAATIGQGRERLKLVRTRRAAD